MAQENHNVLPEITAEAQTKLPPAEFERAVHASEDAGVKASSFEGWRWVIALGIGAGLVAAILWDWRVLFPTAALMLFYSIPLIVAARMTAADGAEAKVLRHRAEDQPGTAAAGTPPPLVPSQRLDQVPRTPRP